MEFLPPLKKNMHLYHLTLQRPTSITCVAYGNFSAPKAHEVVVARGGTLELLKADESGHLVSVLSTESFSGLRCLLSVRLLGQTTDYLAVTSDSGRLSLLKYSKEANAWERLQMETFGKSGVRRTTPGQFLAKDPHGRALMVAAVEKQKFVYQLNRDASSALTISSPLEAHRSRAIVFDAVGLDNGFENPIFCCLETEYPEEGGDAAAAASAGPPPKQVVHYELDLGLNSVVRKWARETDPGASALLALPGGADGPGGVLVLCENWVLYESPSAPAAMRTPLPRRSDFPDERGLLLIAATLHKSRSGFFALLQSELGDLYKVTLALAAPATEGAPPTVTELTVKYFDTIPPAASLAITRNGLLFAAGDGGSHALYQFQGLGDADPVAEAKALRLDDMTDAEGGTVEVVIPVFLPRPLKNLGRLDENLGIHPLCEARLVIEGAAAVVPAAASFGGGGASASASAAVAAASSPASIIALVGKGSSSSSLLLLRQGLPATEVAVSPMQASPNAVFTLKSPSAAASSDPGPDTRIVLSFSNATVVLGVGESVEELSCEALGFVGNAPTLAVTLLPDGSYVQVHPAQMRVIAHTEAGVKGAVKAWAPPKPRTIVAAATNARQIVLALSGGGMQSFEYDAASRRPEEREKTTLPGGMEVVCLALSPVAMGRQRTPFCAIADSSNMVRILSLERDKGFEQLSTQALRCSAASLALVPSPTATVLYLYLGLTNGVLIRLSVDAFSGALSDPRPRFLGPKPVRLAPVRAGGTPSLLAMSTRSFLAYSLDGKHFTQPLASLEGGTAAAASAAAASAPFEAAASFSSDALSEAIVAVSGSTLRILTLGSLGQPLHVAATLPLSFTPRRTAFHAPTGLWVVASAQHDALGEAGCALAAQQAKAAHPEETAAAESDLIAARGAAEKNGGSVEMPRLAASPPSGEEGGGGGTPGGAAFPLWM